MGGTAGPGGRPGWIVEGGARKRARRRKLFAAAAVLLATVAICVVVALVVVFNYENGGGGGAPGPRDELPAPPPPAGMAPHGGDAQRQSGSSSDTVGSRSSVKQQPDARPRARRHEVTVRSEARTQAVTVYTPAQYYDGGGGGAPLLVLLHGLGGTGPQIGKQYGMADASDDLGFVWVAPSAVNSGKRARAWCATDVCCCERGISADKYASDSLFLGDMIRQIIREFPGVDADRVYLIGISNGGYMSHRMACDHSEMIAGIMNICGGHFRDLRRSCRATSPVHVLHLHGTRDTVVPYRGSRYRHGAEDNLRTWCVSPLRPAPSSPPRAFADPLT